MKILTTGMEWFSENPGGLPRYFADYLAAWANHGFGLRALVRTGSIQGVEVKRPAYLRSVYLNSSNPLRVRQEWQRAISYELSVDRYDVFNPHFAYYAWAWLSAKSQIRVDVPVVTHFHGPWAYEARLEGRSRSSFHARLKSELRFHLQRSIERRVYQFADRFIVLSRFFQEQLTQLYGVPRERIHIIPGAVDVSRFHDAMDRERVRESLGLPTDALILVSVRRLVRRMGLDNLIRSVASLRKDFPNLYLVIVGGGELYEELQQLISSLKMQHIVRLTNRVSDEFLPLYYQAADLTVVPSLDLEGFGLTTVESMACGTPVAGTPVGGTKEILQQFDKRLLFEGTSVQDVTEGLGEVLSRFGQVPSRTVTREYVLRNYTWDVVTPQIHSVFLQA